MLLRTFATKATKSAAASTGAKAAAAAANTTAATSASASSKKKKASDIATTPAATAAAPAAPKPLRQLSGYNLFASEFLSKHEGKRIADMALQWKQMPQEEKTQFSTRAANLPPREPKPVKVRLPKQKSAWDVYLQSFRESKDASGLTAKEVMVRAAEKYKLLTEEDKQKLKPAAVV